MIHNLKYHLIFSSTSQSSRHPFRRCAPPSPAGTALSVRLWRENGLQHEKVRRGLTISGALAACVKNLFFADQNPCKGASFKQSAFSSLQGYIKRQKISLAAGHAECWAVLSAFLPLPVHPISTPLPALRATFPCGDGFKRAALA